MATENFLQNTIKWLLMATLLTPLIVSSSTLFPFVFGKALAFQVLVEIAIICYAWLLLINYKRTGSFDSFLPKTNLLFWSLMVFLTILILSTIFSVDAGYSFWSKQERMDGLFNLFHFFAFFFILSAVIKDKKSWLQILDISVIISFIISLHALGQRFDLFSTPYGNRLTSTLGNAAFLATYLLFNIFFAILLLFSRHQEKIWPRIWYLAVLLLEVPILFLTYTRGAIFGLVFGFLIFLIGFAVFAPPNRFKKYAFIPLLAIFVSSGALFAFRHANFVKNSPLLYRLTDISLAVGTGKTRIISWKIGLNAFLEKPLLGWGLENYYVAFNKHLDPIFFTYSGETFDRAHNKIVDVLTMNGLLGLLAYLFVFIAAFWILWQRRKENFNAALILVSILGAYFVQNFLLFDMPASYLMFFLFLAFVSFAAMPPIIPIKSPPRKERFSKYPLWLPALCWLITIIMVFLLWSGNLKPLLASQKSIEGQKLLAYPQSNDNVAKLGVDKYKESINSNTFANPETKKTLAQIIISIVNQPTISDQVKTEALRFAANQLEEGIKEKPLFVDYYLHLADVYTTLSAKEPGVLQNGEIAIKKGATIYPKVPHIYYKLTVNRVMAKDYSQAIEFGNQSIQLNPKLPTGHWYLGIAYLYAGNTDQAKIQAEKAIELGHGYHNLSGLLFLTQLYDTLQDYNKSIAYYQEAIKIDPKEVTFRFGLAKAYKASGQKEKARELAIQLLVDWPQNKSAISEFIVSLEK